MKVIFTVYGAPKRHSECQLPTVPRMGEFVKLQMLDALVLYEVVNVMWFPADGEVWVTVDHT